MRKVKDLLDA